MFVRTVRSMDVRSWVLLILLSFFVSFCGVSGWSYGSSGPIGKATLSGFMTLLLTLVFTVVAALVLLVCNAGLTKLSYASLNKEASQQGPSKVSRFCPQLTVPSVALFALVLIIFWLPYLIATFPGITYADTPISMEQLYEGMHPLDVLSGGALYVSPEQVNALSQANEDVVRTSKYFLTDAYILDHQPFVVTLFYGGLALLSDSLFGNWMPAFGLLFVVQVLLFSVELSFTTAYLRSRGVPPVLCLVIYLIFCLLPFIPLTVACIMKDALFTLFAVPFFLVLTEAMLTRGAVFRKKRMVVALVLLGIGLCLTRKSGIYVVGGVALFACILWFIRFMRDRRTNATADISKDERCASIAFFIQGAVCALLMFALVPGILYPLLNIAPGGRQEVLGTLFQQTARVYAQYGSDALSPEERQAVQGVLRVGNLALEYDGTLTDRTKEKHYLSATDEDIANYLSAYASMGLRYPETYFGSVVATAYGYLTPLKGKSVGAEPTWDMWTWTLDFDDGRLVCWSLDETAPVLGAVISAYNTLDSIPILNILLRGVVYDLWVPVIMLFFSLRNRLRGGVLISFFAMIFMVCLVSPLYDLRYIFPVIMLAPVLVGAMVARAKQVFKERADGAARTSAQ